LWALRMMSESSHAPFLRCFRAFASHRETNGVADAMIEALGDFQERLSCVRVSLLK
jgi:hypothetical protein